MLSLLSVTPPNPDVVSTTLENGETVLMHMGTASYFTLNTTGTKIWELLGQGLNLAAIRDEMVGSYEVSVDQATASLLRLVEELLAQTLLTVEGEPIHG